MYHTEPGLQQLFNKYIVFLFLYCLAWNCLSHDHEALWGDTLTS